MRKVLITGGTSDVGRAVIQRFMADPDFDVWFTYWSGDPASVKGVKSGHGVKLDLAEDFGLPDVKFDALVNCAGVLLSTTYAADVPVADVDMCFAINARAPFLAAAQVIPHMVAAGWGRIVNVGSIWSERGTDANVAYNMSKHALLGLTRTLAKEYGGDGVLTNQVDPGAIDGRLMREAAISAASSGSAGSEDEFLYAVAARNPVGRLVRPADVASLVYWLVAENQFTNGVAVPVDGGLIA